MPVVSLPRPQPRVGWKPLFFCPIASGLLLWMSFQSFWLSWLALPALVPLSLLVRMHGSLRAMYLGAYVGGIAFYLPGFYWIGYCAPDVWLALLLRLLLTVYLACYFPLYVFSARILNRRLGLPLLFSLPIAWTAMEYIRMNFLTGLGWMLIAHAAYEWHWTIQLADFSGVYGVSFFLVLCNAMLVELLTQPLARKEGEAIRFDPTGALRWRLCTTFAVVVFTFGYGWHRVREGLAGFRPGPDVVLIHSTVPQSVRNEQGRDATKEIRELSLKTPREGADLVIWPETSFLGTMYGEIGDTLGDLELARLAFARFFPMGPPEGREASKAEGENVRGLVADGVRQLQELCDQHGVPMLVSLIRSQFQPGRYSQFNAAVLVTPVKGEAGHYDKIHLVPFGEYVPLKDSLPVLRRMMPYPPDVDFGLDHGSEAKLLHYGKLHFGVLICFEDTVTYLARAMRQSATVEKPMDFLVNQSNDGWFEGSSEPDLHLMAGVFRCIENRAPMVRSTNYGATALVDGNGRIAARAPTATPGHLRVRIPLDGRTSVYTARGDWLPILCCTILAAALISTIVVVAQRTNARLKQPRKLD